MKRNVLKERMESEGFGKISITEGVKKPEYFEEYVEKPIEKSEENDKIQKSENEDVLTHEFSGKIDVESLLFEEKYKKWL